MSFENNPRRIQELAMRPAIDAIYSKVWPGCTIKRFEHENDVILDIRYAIDVQVTLPNGMKLLGQEKALSYEYRRFETVTLEYYNDPLTKAEGDWFHIAAQFYFCGYATEDKRTFSPWVLLNWLSCADATRDGRLQWSTPQDNLHSRAKASFRYVNMRDIPANCVVASSFTTMTRSVAVQPAARPQPAPTPTRTYTSSRASSIRTVQKRA